MQRKNLILQNAFTIVELLVVIGIISILAVALLVTLNPAEAQRRARDTQRVKDLNNLQAVVENFIGDSRVFGTCAGTPCESSSATFTTSAAQRCDTNWLDEDLCDYARTIPADPLNGQTGRTCASNNAGTPITQNGCTFRYRFEYLDGNYEIATLLESQQNGTKAANDGGLTNTVEAYWLQIFSGSSAIMTTSTASAAGPAGP